jgi:hypothetical protein
MSLLFVSVGSAFAPAAEAQSKASGDPLALLAPLVRGKPLGRFEEMTLAGGVKTQSIVFRETLWELKDEPQSVDASGRMEREAMKLPEAERLELMNRIDDHIQIWIVPLKGEPKVGANLKAALPPNPQPHEHFREMAYLGQGHGYAWYMYAPIYARTFVQEKLGLQGGEDPLAAAVRGTTVEDRGMCTRNSCAGLLGAAGPRAFPYIEKAIAEGHPLRCRMVSELRVATDLRVTEWLVRQTRSPGRDVARTAKVTLIWSPRKEAAALYLKWLEESAGKKTEDWPNDGAQRLLMACKEAGATGIEKILPRVLESPTSLWEYRAAFLMQRELAGRPVAKAMLDAEAAILKTGYAGNTENNLDKVQEAVKTILAADDAEAAATIGLCLATWSTKANTGAANEAGREILRQVPGDKGKSLAALLARTCVDDSTRAAMAQVLKALNAAK